jgi:hypothetical protein
MSTQVEPHPDFIIWWSGTQGQASWLQHFSETLRNSGVLQRMPSAAEDLPPQLRPLFALEHPDLVVSTGDGVPLISIEITEQAAFGSNSQQRMARMWSAVANGIACAYLLPIESYQIDFDSARRGERLSRSDESIRELAQFVDAVPGLRLSDCEVNGTHSPYAVKQSISKGDFRLPEHRRAEVYNFFRRHILDEGEARHLPMVPTSEAYHAVGDRWFRAYLRRPGVPESMVLEWLLKASKYSPAFAFQLMSDPSKLFETNGTPHLLSYPDAPHLQYQNLPLPPGQGTVVNRKSGYDEMHHFFCFVEAALEGDFQRDFNRSHLSYPNEYFDESVIFAWRKDLAPDVRLVDGFSADFRLTTKRFFGELLPIASTEQLAVLADALEGLEFSNVLRIYNSTPSRSLGDPYSGMLATRDVLFCRGEADAGLRKQYWRRDEGLVFWVEMRGEAINRHPFLRSSVVEQLRRIGLDGSPMDLQSAVTLMLDRCYPDEIPKGLRSHLVFCDVVVVQRGPKEDATYEIVLGLPSLIRTGQLDTSALAYQGLFT